MADIDKIVAIDVETSGFNYGNDVTTNYQILSISLIVSDRNFKIIDQLYCEIKPNGTSRWTTDAEKVHGFSREYLEVNGVSEEDAVTEITEFLLRHFDINEYICFLGYNPQGFAIPFFKKLTNKYGITFKITSRMIDAFSIGFVALGLNDSKEMFEMFNDKIIKHNALEDAKMILTVCRKIRKLMGGLVNE